jgi:inositol-phosphate phosphatase / L-galactose 1-phosphate phosphatase
MTDPASSPDIDYHEILKVAKQAAKLAGAEIQRVWWQSSTSSSSSSSTMKTNTKSSNVDLVTETDEKAEQLIIDLLTQTYPSHKIIGEESSGADCVYTLTDDPTWTIDPVDGTTNFVHRLGLSCVLVAFLIDKDVKVGVTYNPTSEELFWAIKGQGAFLETSDGLTRRIHVSSTRDVQQALIAVDPGYGRDDHSVNRYISVQRDLLRQGVRSLRTYGCCGLCLASVACGRFDACFEEGSWDDNTGPKIWDLSAGKLLVEEAGGVTRDMTHRVASNKDQPMDILQRSSFVAATSELADSILEIIYNAK